MNRGEAFAVAFAGTLAALALVGVTVAVYWPEIKGKINEAATGAIKAQVSGWKDVLR